MYKLSKPKRVQYGHGLMYVGLAGMFVLLITQFPAHASLNQWLILLPMGLIIAGYLIHK